MGNNQSDMESGEDYQLDVVYNPTPIEAKYMHEDSADDILENYQEGPDTYRTNEANLIAEDQASENPTETANQKKKSLRVKKVEDYFQWDGLTAKQKDMYYDFIKTAKKTWTGRGYEDDEVEKQVLNKISLLRF